MSRESAEIVNDILPAIVDSCLGYKKAHDLVGDQPGLQSLLLERYERRNEIADQMQSYVKQYGLEAKEDGQMLGSVHRTWTDVAAKFGDDVKTAMSAVETGEEHLKDKIKDTLDDEDLDADARSLLHRALKEAEAGEKMADAYDG